VVFVLCVLAVAVSCKCLSLKGEIECLLPYIAANQWSFCGKGHQAQFSFHLVSFQATKVWGGISWPDAASYVSIIVGSIVTDIRLQRVFMAILVPCST
jgi:hypothetical protein